MRREWSKLKQETSGDLNLFLSEDGTKALQKYEEFFTAGGSFELYSNEFELALVSAPDQERSIALLNNADLSEGF